MNWEDFLGDSLDAIASQNLLRKLRGITSAQGAEVVCEGRRFRNFSSNDYLGLAAHPALIEAARQALETGGFGAGASRLVCGTLEAHEQLESALAAFKRCDAALSFSSGYAAAMGTIPAICGTNDVIILDKLCHACLVDAAKLSGAHVRVFPHNNLEKMESHLKWAARVHPQARVLILAESVYSMDGDLARLREMVEIKERFGAWLFLDEAHGVGVLGDGGRGLADAEGVAGRIEIQMGTLGKALGAHGAYVAGSAKLKEFLINRARSFIFSTAPPVPVAAAAARAVEIIAGGEGDSLRMKLWENIRAFRLAGLAESAIVPIMIGDEAAAMNASARLLGAGFLIPAIRYPTVARGAARLRVTFSASHSVDDIMALNEALVLENAGQSS